MILIEFIDGTKLVGDFQASAYGGNSSSHIVVNHIGLMKIINDGVRFIRLMNPDRDRYNENGY